MSSSSSIIDHIATLPFSDSKNLLQKMHLLIHTEALAWSAYCNRVQTQSYASIYRSYRTGIIDQTEFHNQTLFHLTHTLPARMAMLLIKVHPTTCEDEDDYSVALMARKAMYLQDLRAYVQAGKALGRDFGDQIIQFESFVALLELRHAEDVESLRVELRADWREGVIEGTADVVGYARWMVLVGINIEDLFERAPRGRVLRASGRAGGAFGGSGVEGDGVGISPWW